MNSSISNQYCQLYPSDDDATCPVLGLHQTETRENNEVKVYDFQFFFVNFCNYFVSGFSVIF